MTHASLRPPYRTAERNVSRPPPPPPPAHTYRRLIVEQRARHYGVDEDLMSSNHVIQILGLQHLLQQLVPRTLEHLSVTGRWQYVINSFNDIIGESNDNVCADVSDYKYKYG